MKTLTKDTTAVDAPDKIELYDSVLDNLVQVKNRGNSVVVRLTRDNLSAPAKTSFIRCLAVEGLIPDRYQRYSESTDGGALDVKWVIDSSWVRIRHLLKRQATRVYNYLSPGRLVALGLFLAAFITAMWFKKH